MARTIEVQILNPAGLHARPAAQIVERAKEFEATIELASGKRTANARSIMSVLALGADTGDQVTITADGPDEDEAVDFIVGIVTDEEGK